MSNIFYAPYTDELTPDEQALERYTEGPDSDILTLARIQLADSKLKFEPIYKAGRHDARMLAGDQWPDGVKKLRQSQKRPSEAINIERPLVDRLLGDMRQNQHSIEAFPVDPAPENDEKFHTVAGKDYIRADVLGGAIKGIEYASNADEHYDRAMTHQVEQGLGWLYLKNSYNGVESFDQNIEIKSAERPDMIFPDPRAQEPDFSDMGYLFRLREMTEAELRAKYPEKAKVIIDEVPGYSDFFDQLQSRSGEWHSNYKGWNHWWDSERNMVTVVEYYRRVAVEENRYLLSDGRTVDSAAWAKISQEIPQEGQKNVTLVRSRTIKTHQVEWRLMTGWGVLEGPAIVPCNEIPFAPVKGREIVVDDELRLESAVRHAHGAQVTANWMNAAFIESVSEYPKAKILMPDDMLSPKHKEQWEQAHTKRQMYLTYQTSESNPAAAPIPIPPNSHGGAEMNAFQQASSQVQSIIGIHEPMNGQQSNELSGVAIRNRQSQSEMRFFVYVDNLATAKKAIGRKILKMLPRVYDSERYLRIRTPDDQDDWVTVGTMEGDLSAGTYDVRIRTGPSYNTQRERVGEFLQSMMTAFTGNPSAQLALSTMMVDFLDLPNQQRISRQLLRIMGAISPQLLSPEQRKQLEEENKEQSEQQLQIAQLEAQAKQRDQQLDEMKIQATVKQAEASMVTSQAQAAVAQIALEEKQLSSQLKIRQEGSKTEREELQVVQQAEQTEQDRLQTEQEFLQYLTAAARAGQEGVELDKKKLDLMVEIVKQNEVQSG